MEVNTGTITIGALLMALILPFFHLGKEMNLTSFVQTPMQMEPPKFMKPTRYQMNSNLSTDTN